MKRSKLLSMAMGLALVGGVHAGAIIHVTSDNPATVYLDEEEIGDAPVNLTDLKPGKHYVKVENVESGEVKTYKVVSPKVATLERDIHVSFTQAQTTVAPAPSTVPVAAPPAPAAVPVVAPAAQTEPSANGGSPSAADQAAIEKKTKDRIRNRTRNVVLGAALTNEVFNRNDQSKDFIRKAAVAVGLGNEALNR